MKTKKPSKKSAIDVAALAGGAIGGGMLSNGIISVVHKPSGATDAPTLKKEKNMLLIKRVAFIAIAGFGAASIDGGDATAQAAKGACIGVAVAQATEAIKGFAAESTAIKTGAAATTSMQRFISNSVGLGCACTEGLGKTRRKNRRGMGMIFPTAHAEIPVYNLQGASGSNPLQDALNEGRFAS